jgi:hypothetical protein
VTKARRPRLEEPSRAALGEIPERSFQHAIVLALVGCGGAIEGAKPRPNADAGSDGGNPPDAGPGDARYDTAPEVGAGGCVPDEQTPCSTAGGCPTYGVCTPNGFVDCPLSGSCSLPLAPDACSWRVETVGADFTEYGRLGRSPVHRVELDGGTMEVLPMVASEQDCSANGGWFAAWAEGAWTVTLCPTQCDEHTPPPRVAFVLEWIWAVPVPD